MAKCVKCKAAPRRARGQRWCPACHAAYQRARLLRINALPLGDRLARVIRNAREYDAKTREIIARRVKQAVKDT